MDYEKIISKITPKRQEKEAVKKFTNNLVKTINHIAEKKNIKAKATVVGSVAKGTWLRGEADIDIFIKFPLETPEEKLKEDGLYLGYECIKAMGGQAEERYAAHPYVTGHMKGYEVDLVPCYDIEDASQLKSAVDRTILHTRYIKKNLKKEQRKEVLLLKKFMKAIGAYGSEFKVGGFAGYLCELLIIAYRNFQSVLEAAALKWRKGQIIDIEGHGTGKYFDDPLIVIDPTDKNRNVAAALTQQKLSEFIIVARSFLENPKEEYFQKVEYSHDKGRIKAKFMERGSKCIILEFNPPSVPADTLYPQLKKTMDTLVSHFSREGFKVNRSAYWTDEKKISLIIFEFETWKLPAYKKHMGPRIWSRKHTKRFHKKYGDRIWIEDDRLFVERKRKATKPESYLKSLLSRIEYLRVGKHVKEELKKGYKIFNIKEFLESEQPREVLEFLDAFLDPGKHLWRS